MCTHVPGIKSHFRYFVLAKLATSSIRVKEVLSWQYCERQYKRISSPSIKRLFFGHWNGKSHEIRLTLFAALGAPGDTAVQREANTCTSCT